MPNNRLSLTFHCDCALINKCDINESCIITVFMIIGRSGRLKAQPPAEQASSERIESRRPKQISNAGKERIFARKDHIFLYYITAR